MIEVVTLREVQEAPPVLHLVLKLRLQTRVLALTDEMRQSQLIPQEQINLFVSGFMEQNPANKEEHEWISLQFCYLLHTIIEPTLAAEKDTNNQLKLEEFHTKVMQFLQETVPPQETADQFLETFRRFAAERKVEKQRWVAISQNSAETMRQAAELANKIQAKMITQFEELKTRLKAINDSRRTVSAELKDILQELEERIKKINGAMMQITKEQSRIADRMKADTENFDRIADLYELVLKRV